MSVRDIVQAAAGAGGGAITPWELTNATFNGTPFNQFSVAGQDTSPQGVFFKSDGTKMYVTGTTGDSVSEYDLSTAWSLANAKYLQNFSVSSQDIAPSDLFFKPDGTKMYVVGSTGQDINEYSLSTAWDISTASYVQIFSVASQETAPQAISFKDDGTKMYVCGPNSANVNEYSLSTAWDISSASYVQNFSVSAQDTAPYGLFFRGNGTTMYIVGDTNNSIFEYSLSSAWDVSTASYVQSFSVASQDINPQGMFFKDDGMTMYVIGRSRDAVYSYDLSSAWDISTASYSFPPTTEYFSVATEETSPIGLFFKSDGTKMYVLGSSGDDVNEYNLSIAWDISSASYSQNFSIASQELTPTGLFFKPDGTKMYICGTDGDDVNEYSLSSAWDISTASYVQNFSVVGQETVVNGLFFKPDGTKMYIIGSNGDDINEYNLSVVWDISTASYLQNFSVASQESTPRDLFFKDDGTKVYITGSSFDNVYEYSLSTAWDISTASYVQSFFVATYETGPQALAFKNDGSKLYIVGDNSDAVWSFDL